MTNLTNQLTPFLTNPILSVLCFIMPNYYKNWKVDTFDKNLAYKAPFIYLKIILANVLNKVLISLQCKNKWKSKKKTYIFHRYLLYSRYYVIKGYKYYRNINLNGHTMLFYLLCFINLNNLHSICLTEIVKLEFSQKIWSERWPKITTQIDNFVHYRSSVTPKKCDLFRYQSSYNVGKKNKAALFGNFRWEFTTAWNPLIWCAKYSSQYN